MGAEVDNVESDFFLYVLNLKNSLFVLIFFYQLLEKAVNLTNSLGENRYSFKT